jgi:hypothetical protein
LRRGAREEWSSSWLLLDRILLYARVPDGSTAMRPVRKALLRTALREDAEKDVFGDREGRALAEEFGFTCHTRPAPSSPGERSAGA